MPTRQQILDKFNGDEEAMRQFFKKIGAKGGAKERSEPRWFAANPELARIAGIKSARVSRERRKKKLD